MKFTKGNNLMPRKPLSMEHIATLVRMRRDGAKYRQIAFALKISAMTVQRYCKLNGI